ncbi:MULTISPECIES: hypothetical protein [Bradyrhizobium]|uniref:Uncharacterized protein n=1 Tax=Bradyrhizobium elkanii TaxID=29448 RepID=A0A4U6RTX7_BRAEL|nr:MULTISPECIES: hypothetical protein [Bradyrhizobium]MTV11693.1 hypothetical protein [Bradyrhizobium sp. BR2003]TKV77761.1 hypothetical protein FDV58_29670 [Bradyrhizobium elkanii]
MDAPHRSDRNETWLKVRMGASFWLSDFIKSHELAATNPRKREGKEPVHVGKVATGLNRTTSSKIRKALDSVISPKSKLSKPLKKPKAIRVELIVTGGNRMPRT